MFEQNAKKKDYEKAIRKRSYWNFNLKIHLKRNQCHIAIYVILIDLPLRNANFDDLPLSPPPPHSHPPQDDVLNIWIFLLPKRKFKKLAGNSKIRKMAGNRRCLWTIPGRSVKNSQPQRRYDRGKLAVPLNYLWQVCVACRLITVLSRFLTIAGRA